MLGLSQAPDHVYVDGNRCPEIPYSVEAVVKGDSKVAEISAASIIASSRLYLSDNQLRSVPESIGQLVNLTV